MFRLYWNVRSQDGLLWGIYWFFRTFYWASVAFGLLFFLLLVASMGSFIHSVFLPFFLAFYFSVSLLISALSVVFTSPSCETSLEKLKEAYMNGKLLREDFVKFYSRIRENQIIYKKRIEKWKKPSNIIANQEEDMSLIIDEIERGISSKK